MGIELKGSGDTHQSQPGAFLKTGLAGIVLFNTLGFISLQ